MTLIESEGFYHVCRRILNFKKGKGLGRNGLDLSQSHESSPLHPENSPLPLKAHHRDRWRLGLCTLYGITHSAYFIPMEDRMRGWMVKAGAFG
jgi:hypothetical protein